MDVSKYPIWLEHDNGGYISSHSSTPKTRYLTAMDKSNCPHNHCPASELRQPRLERLEVRCLASGGPSPFTIDIEIQCYGALLNAGGLSALETPSASPKDSWGISLRRNSAWAQGEKKRHWWASGTISLLALFIRPGRWERKSLEFDTQCITFWLECVLKIYFCNFTS